LCPYLSIEYDTKHADLYPAAVKEVENRGSKTEVAALHHVEHASVLAHSTKPTDETDLHPAVLKEAENRGSK
jgi:hypothetical protein